MTREEIKNTLKAVLTNNDSEPAIEAGVKEALKSERFLGPMVICDPGFRSCIIKHEVHGQIEAMYTPPFRYEDEEDSADDFDAPFDPSRFGRPL